MSLNGDKTGGQPFSPTQAARANRIGIFAPGPFLKVRAISGTAPGQKNQERFFDTINIGWRDAMSPSMGVDFFNARHKESALMVYPIELARFKRFGARLKHEVVHATLVFDDESFQELVGKAMANWILPPVNLIAVGFTPDWDAAGLPANSPIRSGTECPSDASKAQIFQEITREKSKAVESGMPPVPRVRGPSVNDDPPARSCKECSIM